MFPAIARRAHRLVDYVIFFLASLWALGLLIVYVASQLCSARARPAPAAAVEGVEITITNPIAEIEDDHVGEEDTSVLRFESGLMMPDLSSESCISFLSETASLDSIEASILAEDCTIDYSSVEELIVKGKIFLAVPTQPNPAGLPCWTEHVTAPSSGGEVPKAGHCLRDDAELRLDEDAIEAIDAIVCEIKMEENDVDAPDEASEEEKEEEVLSESSMVEHDDVCERDLIGSFNAPRGPMSALPPTAVVAAGGKRVKFAPISADETIETKLVKVELFCQLNSCKTFSIDRAPGWGKADCREETIYRCECEHTSDLHAHLRDQALERATKCSRNIVAHAEEWIRKQSTRPPLPSKLDRTEYSVADALADHAPGYTAEADPEVYKVEFGDYTADAVAVDSLVAAALPAQNALGLGRASSIIPRFTRSATAPHTGQAQLGFGRFPGSSQPLVARRMTFSAVQPISQRPAFVNRSRVASSSYAHAPVALVEEDEEEEE